MLSLASKSRSLAFLAHHEDTRASLPMNLRSLPIDDLIIHKGICHHLHPLFVARVGPDNDADNLELVPPCSGVVQYLDLQIAPVRLWGKNCVIAWATTAAAYCAGTAAAIAGRHSGCRACLLQTPLVPLPIFP